MEVAEVFCSVDSESNKLRKSLSVIVLTGRKSLLCMYFSRLYVCHAECCLWGTPRVESQMVQSVFSRCDKHFHPATLVGRRCAGKGKNAALQRSSEECRLAVYEQTIAFGLKAAHSECGGFLLLAGHYRQ